MPGHRAPVRLLAGISLLLRVLTSASPLSAQAWGPPRGAGSLTISTQVIDNTGHRMTDGFLLEDGKSTTVAVYVEGDYGLTDRISVSLAIPYVFARYRGPGPTPANLPVDQCKCWHSGWQDLGGVVRLNVLNGTVALTPSFAFGVPSHRYGFEGEAVIGYGLREARVALDSGVRFDALSPKLSVQGRYAYTFVERAVGISHNRSNVTATGAYQATRRLSTRGIVLWQHTHGGVRFGSLTGVPFFPPGEANTPERFRQHDRLLHDCNWRLGGDLGYSFTGFDIFASYLHFMGGTDTHAGYTVTIGLSWPFGT